jgi:hypothetical protein
VYQSIAARIASDSVDTFRAFSKAKYIQPVHELVFLYAIRTSAFTKFMEIRYSIG